MQARKLGMAILVLVGVIAASFVIAEMKGGNENHESNNFFNLNPPPFIGRAEASSSGGGYFPENEAGFSAYLKPTSSINLTMVKPVFASIDMEENNYIIGTVSVTALEGSADTLPEDFYPYMYIDTSGWIVSYYPKDMRPEPSRIVPFGYFPSSNTTNLAEVIKKVCNQINVPFGYEDVGYYDFRYPDATKMLMAMEKNGNFYVHIPVSFTVKNISWAYITETYCVHFNAKLDGQKFVEGGGLTPKFGYFSQTEFAKGVQHEIRIKSSVRGETSPVYVGIVILYSQ